MAAALLTGYAKDTAETRRAAAEKVAQSHTLPVTDDLVTQDWLWCFRDAKTVRPPVAEEEEGKIITPDEWLRIALISPAMWRTVAMAVPCIGRFALKRGIMAKVAWYFIHKAKLPRLVQATDNGRRSVFLYRICSRRHGLVVEGHAWGNLMRTTLTLLDRGVRAKYLGEGLPNQMMFYTHKDQVSVHLRFHRMRRASINYIELAIGGTAHARCHKCSHPTFFICNMVSSLGTRNYAGGHLCLDCRCAVTFTPACMLVWLSFYDMELSPLLTIPRSPERAIGYMRDLEESCIPKKPGP